MDAGSIPNAHPAELPRPVRVSYRLSVTSSLKIHLCDHEHAQGEVSMERFPFVAPESSAGKSKMVGVAEPHHRRSLCQACTAAAEGSRYDLWHVLFECPKTRDTLAIADVRNSCRAFVPQLGYAIEMAVDLNAKSVGDLRNAGVHSATCDRGSCRGCAGCDYWLPVGLRAW